MDRKLGTFYGVFTPTLLTILGVIMYLRFGWLVGNLGLATPEKGKETEAAQRMEALSEGLTNVFFVKNASLFIGDLVTPEVEEEPETEPPAQANSKTD